MAPQQVILPPSSSSVPVSPSMVQHQKINNKKNGGSYDDSSIIIDNNNNNRQKIKQQYRRCSLSRQSLEDVSNNYNNNNNNNETLSYSDDNNLIDLTSEKSIQSSTDTINTYSYPAHQQEARDELKKENGTTDIPSGMDDYQSNNDNMEHSKEDNKMDERGNPAACIFVASLTKGKNDEELNVSVTKHFEQWGTLLNVKVLKDWLGRPYAFVQFERMQAATIALSEAPGTILDGRNIRCEPARVNRTISISSCGPPLILQEIQLELAEFGKIEDITVLHNYPLPTNNSNSGNGVGECIFVKYCYRDDAVKAFLTLSKMNQKWCVEWASNLDTTMGKHNTQVTNTSNLAVGNNCFNGNNDNDNNGRGRSFSQERVNVFIGNLFDDIAEQELKERFEQYGIILDLRIIRKSVPFKRVFAFIRYKEYAEAKKAIQMENGLEWHSRKLRVSYREPRESPIGFRLNRRITMERPHPPGLGFPASEHQYLVSNNNNIKKKSSATTLLNNKLKVEENEINKSNNNISNNSSEASTLSDNKKNINGENDKQQQQQHVDEKTAIDNDEQRQQQQNSYNNNNKTSRTINQKQQLQPFVDNNFPALSTIPPPPLHNVGMNRGYMKLPLGGDHRHPVTHRHPHQQHYMTPTIYDPNMYPPLVMNPKDQQQQAPMMFGSTQDAGTTLLEGNVTSAQATIENNLIFVPGHYDYASGVYYGPCYHSLSTPLLTNGPLPPPSSLASSSTTPPSTLPVTTPPVDTVATNAINEMFSNNHNGKTNTLSDNYNNYEQPSMQRTSMSNKNGIISTASGYYYMIPPSLLPLHQHGHPPHNHQPMYHQQTNIPSAMIHNQYHHPTGTPINNYNGDYNKHAETSNTTSMPLSAMNGQNNKQQHACMNSSMNKNGRTDSSKKITIISPTTNNNKNASEQQK